MIYIIDNGCGWSDRTIYFVKTDYSLEVVKQCADAINSQYVSDDYYKMTVCMVTERYTWIEQNKISTMSLPEFLEEYLLDMNGEIFCGLRELPDDLLRQTAKCVKASYGTRPAGTVVIEMVEKFIAEKTQ